MATILFSLPVSLSALRTPLMEPSLAPKKPLRSGLAVIIALAMSADLTASPAPYWGGRTLMFGYFAAIWARNPSRRVIPVWLVWSWTMTPTVPALPMRLAMWSAAAAVAADPMARLIGNAGTGGV